MGKLSKIWMGFYEVINLETDSPVIVCKKYSQEYDHPRWKDDSSTSTIKKYYDKYQEMKSRVINMENME